jgi:hypothetical protein
MAFDTNITADHCWQKLVCLPLLYSMYIDFCSVMAAPVGPVQNIFFLTEHYFHSFVPMPQQAGQAAVLGRLSLLFMHDIMTCHHQDWSVPWLELTDSQVKSLLTPSGGLNYFLRIKFQASFS